MWGTRVESNFCLLFFLWDSTVGEDLPPFYLPCLIALHEPGFIVERRDGCKNLSVFNIGKKPNDGLLDQILPCRSISLGVTR